MWLLGVLGDVTRPPEVEYWAVSGGPFCMVAKAQSNKVAGPMEWFFCFESWFYYETLNFSRPKCKIRETRTRSPWTRLVLESLRKGPEYESFEHEHRIDTTLRTIERRSTFFNFLERSNGGYWTMLPLNSNFSFSVRVHFPDQIAHLSSKIVKTTWVHIVLFRGG